MEEPKYLCTHLSQVVCKSGVMGRVGRKEKGRWGGFVRVAGCAWVWVVGEGVEMRRKRTYDGEGNYKAYQWYSDCGTKL